MADVSQVKEITARLEQGVKDLFESDTYADYLKTMSRFHQYSTRNTILIHMQMPGATLCCGFRGWQTKFGRHVVKGAKAIRILAPAPFVIREEKERLDPDTRQPVLDENGMPVVEQIERQFARFKVTNVFDVSQTQGKPLPTLTQDLTGNVEQYEAFMDALRFVSPLPIVFEPMPDDTDGVCRFGENIAIREGMSEIQTVCAAIHEITHAKLHDLTLTVEDDENTTPKDRHTEEVEAESVSYAVSQFFGIETSANSFGYIAQWGRGRDLKELNASLDTIRKTAAELIGAIESKFHEILKERNIALDSIDEQMELGVLKATEQDENVLETMTAASTSVDRPTPGTVYARYSNQIAAIAGRDEIYMNAMTNADEHEARVESDMAVGRAVYSLFAESMGQHNELFRQYNDNPDFKARLEDYAFMRIYLEPIAQQRNAIRGGVIEQETDSNQAQNSLLIEYARAKNDLLIGARVLMTPVFVSGNYNRDGKRIRVTVEEPVGKYQLFSQEENGDKVLYFMTASGRIDRTSEYFYGEWDSQQRKYVYPRPSEAEFDDIILQIAEQFERDMSDPEKWAMYQHAAVVNRLAECDAHNEPVRMLREQKRVSQREEQARQEEQKRKDNQSAFDAKIDDLSEKLIAGERIEVEIDPQFEKNLLFALFDRHGVELPLATKGWVNRNLKAFQILQDSKVMMWLPKGINVSKTFGNVISELKNAIGKDKAAGRVVNASVNDDTRADLTAEADKFLEEIGGIGNLFGAPTPPPKEKKRTVENNLHDKFAEMFPKIVNGEYSYLRLESEGFEPLSIEWIDGNRISVMHTYTLNGDLCYDPMIVFEFGFNYDDGSTLTAVEFEQSIPPMYQIVDEGGNGRTIDGNGNEKTIIGLQKSLNEFAAQWLDNISQQGYIPVRANMLIKGEETQITFDKDGNPILPEQEKIEKIYDLGFGHMGNGLTVWNRAEERNHDYVTVAHIDRDRTVTFYDKNMPEDVRERIEKVARTSQQKWFDPLPETFKVSVFTYEDGGYDFCAGSFDKRQDAEAFARLLEDGGYYGVSLKTIVSGINEEYPLTVSMTLEDAQKNANAVERFTQFKASIEQVESSAPEISAEGTAPEPPGADNDILLPDPAIGYSEMNLYGYAGNEMLPLTQNRALELFDADHTIYLLYTDNTEAIAFERDEVLNYAGLFGIEREEWEAAVEFAAMKAAAENSEGSREADLLYGSENRFGIYQLKDRAETRDYRWEPMNSLQSRGLEVDRNNYELIYTGQLGIRDTQTNLHKIYETFNVDRPADFTGHSLAVSDVIVLQWRGNISSHYVDNIGFQELPAFLGEETRQTQTIEPTSQTYSQVGNTSQPTVAELEADVKAGKTISLTDLSRALNAERDNTSVSKGRPSLIERLEEGKRLAARSEQPDTLNKKEREV